MTAITIIMDAARHDLIVDGRTFDLSPKGARHTATRIILDHLFPKGHDGQPTARERGRNKQRPARRRGKGHVRSDRPATSVR